MSFLEDAHRLGCYARLDRYTNSVTQIYKIASPPKKKESLNNSCICAQQAMRRMD
jgi:hypothetical protein